MAEIVLAYDTALALWCNPEIPTDLRICSQSEVRLALASRREVGLLDLKEALRHSPLAMVETPVHTLTSRSSEHDKTKIAIQHKQTAALPEASVLEVSRDVPSAKVVDGYMLGIHVLVCSPELCFVQMANLLDEVELTELGYELCGGYARIDSPEVGMVERPIRTTPERLLEAVCSYSGLKGVKKARRAARLVVAGARSPKESQLTMFTVFLAHQLGLSVGRPLLNVEIPLGERERMVLRQEKIIPDLYWPDARTVVEYDSSEHHGAESLEHDSRKRSTYRLLGLDVIDITYGQLRDFDTIVSILTNVLERVAGKKALPMTSECRKLCENLHRRLLFGERRPRQFSKEFLALLSEDAGE